MEQKPRNPYSVSVWQSTKDEAGLVVLGVAGGATLGVGGGYLVSQGFGTPVVPSMIVGGVAGGAVGGASAAYVAHRIHEARADAAAEALRLAALANKGELSENVGESNVAQLLDNIEKLTGAVLEAAQEVTGDKEEKKEKGKTKK